MLALFHYLKFSFKQRPLWFWLIAFTIVLTVVYALRVSSNDKWENYMGVAGFFIGIWILIVNLRDEWVKHLPKRLTVHFIYYKDNKYWMSCWDAPMISSEDARAWAQQLGRSMNGNKDLDLKFFRFARNGDVVRQAGEFCEYFELEYYVGNDENSYKIRTYTTRKNESGTTTHDFTESPPLESRSHKPLKRVEPATQSVQ